MIQISLYMIGGLIGLTMGADWFVSSASHFSRRFGISPVIIGLTIVAFGTSAPELAVSVFAAVQGNNEITVGNVVGSNIFNVAFILGLCSIITPLVISSQLIRIDIPLMLAASLALWGMCQDQQITKTEGLLLLGGLVGYFLLQIKIMLKGKDADAQFAKEYSEKGSPLKDGLKFILGLILLVVGAKFFVDGAIFLARILEMREEIIALTIVAAGTSLPEVATSVTASIKGERDIAIGNVVGSNIFNILGILGISTLFTQKSLTMGQSMMSYDVVVMIFMTLFCMPFMIWGKQLNRWVGIGLFSSWIIYTWTLIK